VIRLALLDMAESSFARRLLADRTVSLIEKIEMEAFCARARKRSLDYEHEYRFTDHEHERQYACTRD
jgi:hypothetical protein